MDGEFKNEKELTDYLNLNKRANDSFNSIKQRMRLDFNLRNVPRTSNIRERMIQEVFDNSDKPSKELSVVSDISKPVKDLNEKDIMSFLDSLEISNESKIAIAYILTAESTKDDKAENLLKAIRTLERYYSEV